METAFKIVAPKSASRPLIVSCPHSGLEIPPEIKKHLRAEEALALADTDWYVHDLYAFARQIGATLIHARYSRYVIDLNRDPNGQKLYNDDRSETSLVPLYTFAGAPLYHEVQPDQSEILRRLDLYYRPYHAALEGLLKDFRKKHHHVLLFDAHSIKRHVPSIRAAPFPDMILGDQQGRTAHPHLIQTALKTLTTGKEYEVAHNAPFMGGYITRHYGGLFPGIHSLQLEMCQDIYMDPDLKQRDPAKEKKVARILEKTLASLSAELEHLP